MFFSRLILLFLLSSLLGSSLHAPVVDKDFYVLVVEESSDNRLQASDFSDDIEDLDSGRHIKFSLSSGDQIVGNHQHIYFPELWQIQEARGPPVV